MKHLLVIAAALGSLLLAQGVVRPAAIAERDSWPKLESHKSIVLQYAHPLLGRELTADILWAQTLVYYGTAMVEGGDYRYIEPYLDAIIETDPRFKRVYHFAAYAVTYRDGRPRQEEFLASLKYLHRALEEYPDDHKYLWIAGSRYFLDLKPDDPELERTYRERGADMLEQAMRKPDAPPSYAIIAASFRSKLGQHERAVQNIKEKILTAPDEQSRIELLDRLRDVLDAPDLADELGATMNQLEASWRENLPYGSPSLFFILGERPSETIEFDQLANERSLFGAD